MDFLINSCWISRKTKFLSNNFTVMLLHYDGIVDEWNDLEWSNQVLHVSAMYQTKWWFAKRFLHPDIVAEYEYIFIWDEDIGVEHFHPRRFAEIMVPVFSRVAWRCVWSMIQNDLVHAWGIDFKFGYCVQGDKTEKIGVVDSEYIVHKGLPTLGGKDQPLLHQVSRVCLSVGMYQESNTWFLFVQVIKRCVAEMNTFHKRWQQAADKDLCWTDPYKPRNE
ncbi:hypothetical protein ZIOFF_020714 [Zingiber officinale]|uniref:Storage protein n=1 Tax=Zingiber officinale TaxID=94328 RepID=A0A8J5H0H7_ZINOF|nr:hypothetical protein ZIOFF_020714 [Zingiber officinale]